MKAREEMPLLRCALGPTGRPFGDGLHSVTASGTDGRKAVITRNWDMAGSTLKKPIRGRKMGVGADHSPLLKQGRGGRNGVIPICVEVDSMRVCATLSPFTSLQLSILHPSCRRVCG